MMILSKVDAFIKTFEQHYKELIHSSEETPNNPISTHLPIIQQTFDYAIL